MASVIEGQILSTREQLAEFARARMFIAARAELIEAGFSASQINSWIDVGRLTTVLHGVYSYGRDVESRDAALKAGLAVAGAGTALTGTTACEKWGLIRRPPTIPALIQVATPTGQAAVHCGMSPAMRNCQVKVVHRSFEPGDVRRVDGLELLDPVLSLIDLAVTASELEVRFAFLEACRLKFFRQPDVRRCYEELHGRRGAKKLRPSLGLWVPELNRIKSVFEGRVVLDLVWLGYPLPEVNVKVHGFEVDMYWRAQRFALELDGGAFHSDPAQKKIDLEKQRFLEGQGETVERLTYRQYDADPIGNLVRIAQRLGYR